MGKKVVIKLQSGSVAVAADRGVVVRVVDLNRAHELPAKLPWTFEELARRAYLTADHVQFVRPRHVCWVQRAVHWFKRLWRPRRRRAAFETLRIPRIAAPPPDIADLRGAIAQDPIRTDVESALWRLAKRAGFLMVNAEHAT